MGGRRGAEPNEWGILIVSPGTKRQGSVGAWIEVHPKGMDLNEARKLM
jgi:hypothetical protein